MSLEQPRQLITDKEALRLLGKDGVGLSEQELRELIAQVELTVDISIKHIKKEVLVPKSM